MKKGIVTLLAWCFLALSLYWITAYLDWHQFWESVSEIGQRPELLLLMTAGYAAAFWLRSLGWSYQMGREKIKTGTLWYYHHIGLFLNHILPVKGGEAARAALLRTREGFSWPEAIVSVGVSRMMDMLGLVLIACTGTLLLSPAEEWVLYGEKLWFTAILIISLASGMYFLFYLPWEKWTPKLVQKYPSMFQQPSWLALAATACGWMLEAVVVWTVVYALGGQLGAGEALVVHVITIIGQTFHVTPGGIGTYEAVMTSLLHQIAGHPLAFALEVAIISHGFKFVYSFIMGVLASWRLKLSPLAFYKKQDSFRRMREDNE